MRKSIETTYISSSAVLVYPIIGHHFRGKLGAGEGQVINCLGGQLKQGFEKKRLKQEVEYNN